MVGRTLLVRGLFESNDDVTYTGITALSCTDGHSLVITQPAGTTTIDLRTVNAVTLIPAGTQFTPGDTASERPPGT